MGNQDILTRVDTLNKKIEAHNQARERTIGTLESYKAQFTDLVGEYKKTFGVDIDLDNVEKVFKSEQARIESELAEKESMLQQIVDGTYKAKAEDVVLAEVAKLNDTVKEVSEETVVKEPDKVGVGVKNNTIKLKTNIAQVVLDEQPVIEDYVEEEGVSEPTDDTPEFTLEGDIEVPVKESEDKFKDIKTATEFDFSNVGFGGIEI